MNQTIKTQLNHRTIRFFKEQTVDPNTLKTILEVVNRTASSNGLQNMSIIRVTDKEKRAQLAKICNQEYVNAAPEFFLFIVDSYRNSQIARAKGYEGESNRSMDFFFQGAADAYLAAQNATNAIESIGMGAVYFGSLLNDAQAVIDLFNLPELTMPILGLGFGYPNDEPELKPRMEIELKVGENSYPFIENPLHTLANYDERMTNYYDTRNANQRVESFTNQVKMRYEVAPELRSQILRVIENQGFDLNIIR